MAVESAGVLTLRPSLLSWKNGQPETVLAAFGGKTELPFDKRTQPAVLCSGGTMSMCMTKM